MSGPQSEWDKVDRLIEAHMARTRKLILLYFAMGFVCGILLMIGATR